jgi:hypothetical protein
MVAGRWKIAKGTATIVLEKLMTVTDHSRSAPVRRKAFHVARMIAAKSASPTTSELIAASQATR